MLKQKALLIGHAGQKLEELNKLLDQHWKVVQIAVASSHQYYDWLVVVEQTVNTPPESPATPS